MSKVKRIFAAMLAVVCLTVFSVSSVFAATSSPVTGQYQTADTGEYRVQNPKTKKIAKVKAKNKNITVDTVAATVTVAGKTLKVTKIGNYTYQGCKKLKKINIKSKDIVRINKAAFKGLKKSQLKKLKVVVTKKMSAKNFKNVKRMLKKVGIPVKNITKSKKW